MAHRVHIKRAVINAGSGKILVVEDDDAERESIVDLLRLWGYDARAASDGIKALQEFVSTAFDLVLSDVVMPRMGGIELLKELHRQFQSVNCIMISGEENELNELEAMRIGARSFLKKPVYPDQLSAEVRRCLAGRQTNCGVTPASTPWKRSRT